MESGLTNEDVIVCAFDFPKLYQDIYAWWGENIRRPCKELIGRYNEHCRDQGREPSRNNPGRRQVRRMGSFLRVTEIFGILNEQLKKMELSKRPSSLLQPRPLTTQSAVKLFKNFYLNMKQLNKAEKENKELKALVEDLLDREEYMDYVLQSGMDDKLAIISREVKDMEQNVIWQEMIASRARQRAERKIEIDEMIEQRMQRKRRHDQIDETQTMPKKAKKGKYVLFNQVCS